MHITAASEPLFLFLMLLAVVLVTQFRRTERLAPLVSSSAVAAMAVMTRYAGLALVATIVIVAVLSGRGWRQRLRQGSIALSIPSVVLVFWIARNVFSGGGGPSGRSFGVHPMSIATLEQGFSTLRSWALPGCLSTQSAVISAGRLLAFMALLLLGTWGAYRNYRERRAESPRPGRAHDVHLASHLGIFTVLYLSLILVSMSFYDAHTRLGPRILTPVLLASVVAGASVVGAALRRHDCTLRASAIALTATAVLLTSNLLCLAPQAQQARRQGIGYASDKWRNSPCLSHIKTVPEGTFIYSNEARGLTLLTKRRIRLIRRDGRPTNSSTI